MFAAFLLEPAVLRESGCGAAVPIGPERPASLLITLGITRVVEQESLHLTIDGSAGGTAFPAPPLLVFPQKFYAGVSAVLIDLTRHPDLTHLRARWSLKRWGHGPKQCLFECYVYAEPGPVLLAEDRVAKAG